MVFRITRFGVLVEAPARRLVRGASAEPPSRRMARSAHGPAAPRRPAHRNERGHARACRGEGGGGQRSSSSVEFSTSARTFWAPRRLSSREGPTALQRAVPPRKGNGAHRVGSPVRQPCRRDCRPADPRDPPSSTQCDSRVVRRGPITLRRPRFLVRLVRWSPRRPRPTPAPERVAVPMGDAPQCRMASWRKLRPLHAAQHTR